MRSNPAFEQSNVYHLKYRKIQQTVILEHVSETRLQLRGVGSDADIALICIDLGAWTTFKNHIISHYLSKIERQRQQLQAALTKRNHSKRVMTYSRLTTLALQRKNVPPDGGANTRPLISSAGRSCVGVKQTGGDASRFGVAIYKLVPSLPSVGWPISNLKAGKKENPQDMRWGEEMHQNQHTLLQEA